MKTDVETERRGRWNTPMTEHALTPHNAGDGTRRSRSLMYCSVPGRWFLAPTLPHSSLTCLPSLPLLCAISVSLSHSLRTFSSSTSLNIAHSRACHRSNMVGPRHGRADAATRAANDAGSELLRTRGRTGRLAACGREPQAEGEEQTGGGPTWQHSLRQHIPQLFVLTTPLPIFDRLLLTLERPRCGRSRLCTASSPSGLAFLQAPTPTVSCSAACFSLPLYDLIISGPTAHYLHLCGPFLLALPFFSLTPCASSPLGDAPASPGPTYASPRPTVFCRL